MTCAVLWCDCVTCGFSPSTASNISRWGNKGVQGGHLFGVPHPTFKLRLHVRVWVRVCICILSVSMCTSWCASSTQISWVCSSVHAWCTRRDWQLPGHHLRVYTMMASRMLKVNKLTSLEQDRDDDELVLALSLILLWRHLYQPLGPLSVPFGRGAMFPRSRSYAHTQHMAGNPELYTWCMCASERPYMPNRYMPRLRLRRGGRRWCQRQDADTDVHMETAPYNFPGGKFSCADAYMET